MRKLSAENKYAVYASLLLICVIIPALPYIKGRLGSAPLAVSLYWCVLTGIIFFILPRLYIIHKGDKDLTGYGISGGIIFIAIQFVPAVFMKKLASSPYDISVLGILFNMITLLPQIAAREMIRQYSFAAVHKTCKYKRAVIVIITVIFCLTEINFGGLTAAKSTKDIFIYSVQTIFPIITKNVLVSLLVFYGGVLPGLIYLSIIQIFQRCFPVLPELPWLLEGSIGIAFPIIYSMFAVDHVFSGYRYESKDRKADIKGLVSLLFATLFVWFCVGVFPIYPKAILTGSMEPLIMPGDMVLIKKIDKEEEISALSEGEIICFKRDDITIVHRIEKVLQDKAGNISFQTKGDNNNAVDERKVEPNDIRGIVIKVIPKVGLPGLLLRVQNKIPEGVVDK